MIRRRKTACDPRAQSGADWRRNQQREIDAHNYSTLITDRTLRLRALREVTMDSLMPERPWFGKLHIRETGGAEVDLLCGPYQTRVEAERALSFLASVVDDEIFSKATIEFEEDDALAAY